MLAGNNVQIRTYSGGNWLNYSTYAVSTGTPKVRGQLSKELIDKEVRRHRPQIAFCYNKELTRNPDLSGKVSLSWIISLDGSVKSAANTWPNHGPSTDTALMPSQSSVAGN